jgi:hypothetical protein
MEQQPKVALWLRGQIADQRGNHRQQAEPRLGQLEQPGGEAAAVDAADGE